MGRLDWIRRQPAKLLQKAKRLQQAKLLQQAKRRQQARLLRKARGVPRPQVDYYVWGERFTLRVSEINAPPAIELEHPHLLLRVRPGTDQRKRCALTEKWYREQIKEAVVPLLAKWQPVMGVQVKHVYVRRMKTRWGSCNYKACTIRLNTELAARLPEGLEYVVVHELVHLLEPSHNARFVALMDRFMPDWRLRRDALSRGPVRREDSELPS